MPEVITQNTTGSLKKSNFFPPVNIMSESWVAVKSDVSDVSYRPTAYIPDLKVNLVEIM